MQWNRWQQDSLRWEIQEQTALGMGKIGATAVDKNRSQQDTPFGIQQTSRLEIKVWETQRL